jgi:hypothetical protein
MTTAHLDTFVETYYTLENTASIMRKTETDAAVSLATHLSELAAGHLMFLAELQDWCGGGDSHRWSALCLAVPRLGSLDGRLRAVQAAKAMAEAGLDGETFLIRQFMGQEIEK